MVRRGRERSGGKKKGGGGGGGKPCRSISLIASDPGVGAGSRGFVLHVTGRCLHDLG